MTDDRHNFIFLRLMIIQSTCWEKMGVTDSNCEVIVAVLIDDLL